MARFNRFVATVLVGILGLAAAPARGAPADNSETPVDLILVIDVSYSMSRNAITARPTDPEGIRWDGIQFLIDTANADDRIAVVLFRGDSVLATSGIPGNDRGYVRVDQDGRERLKLMVAKLKDHEQALANLPAEEGNAKPIEDTIPDKKYLMDYMPLPTLDGKEQWVMLSAGTSNLLALQAVREWKLLPDRPSDTRQLLVLQFTDGVDGTENGFKRTGGKKTFDAAGKPKLIQWDANDFAYLQELGKGASEAERKQDRTKKIQEKTRAVVTPFQNAKAEVFTFGLGADIDHSMLTDIVTKARPERSPGYRGAYYYAKDNIELFQHLQRVAWELRERWKVIGEPVTTTTDTVQYVAPSLSLCRDLGALIYNKQGNRAVAPAGEVGIGRAPGGVPAANKYKSASHQYVRFVPDDKPGGLTLQVGRGPGDDTVCEFGLRPVTPLVTIKQPVASPAYTLLDAVPIEVEFDDVEKKALTPDMFTVVAKVFRPESAGTVVGEIDLKPSLVKDAKHDGKWSYVGKWKVSDANRFGGGEPKNLEGDWALDIVIRSDPKQNKKTPLGDATRLLRRQFQVAGYPGLRVAVPRTGVQNNGPTPGQGVVRIELDTAFAPDGTLSLPSGESLRLVSGWESKLKDLPSIDEAKFVGHNGTAVAEVPLDFTRYDWTTVRKQGEQLKLALDSNVPVSTARAQDTHKATTTIDLNKTPYKLSETSRALIFDLSPPLKDAPEAQLPTAVDSLTVSLATKLRDRAVVRLKHPDAEPLTFARVNDGSPAGDAAKEIKLKLKSARVELSTTPEAGKKAAGELRIELEPLDNKGLPSGRYTAEVQLVHAADSPSEIESIPLTLSVLVNQLKIQFLGIRAGRLEAGALAGTRPEWPVQVSMAVTSEHRVESIRALTVVRPVSASPDQAFRLPERELLSRTQLSQAAVAGIGAFHVNRDDRFLLALDVPASVDPGLYHFPIEFELRAKSKSGVTQVFRSMTNVDVTVKHYGLTAVPLGTDGSPVANATAVKLETDLGKKGLLESKLRLSPTLQNTVRWSVEVVDDLGAPPPPAGQRPWHDAIDLFAAATPAQPSVLRGPNSVKPTTPLAAGQPQDLILRANAAGLAPGRYTCRLRFTPTVVPSLEANPQPGKSPDAGGSGAAFELPVELTVKGTVATLAAEPDGKSLNATVTCTRTEPGTWQIRSDEIPNWSANLKFDPPSGDEITKAYTARVEVPKLRGGTCHFKLVPGNHALTVSAAPVGVQVPVRIVCDKALVAAGNTVTVTVAVAAGSPPPPDIVIARKNIASEKLPNLQLKDDGSGGDQKAGDGIYTGQVADVSSSGKNGFGEYTIDFEKPYPSTAAGPGPPHEPTRVFLGIAKEGEQRRTDTLEYAKGIFEAIDGPERITRPNVVTLKVYGLTNPQYKLRVKYLKAGPDVNRYPAADFGTATTDQFDPTIHLKAEALGPHGTGGAVSKEVPTPFGLDVQLSEDAVRALENGEAHPTLNAQCGLVLVVTITGTDEYGQTVTWEEEMPYAVKTKSFMFRTGLFWLVGGVLLSIVLVVVLIRWWKWKQRKAKRGEQIASGGDDPLLGGGPAPKPKPAAGSGSPSRQPEPPRQRSSADDDDLF